MRWLLEEWQWAKVLDLFPQAYASNIFFEQIPDETLEADSWNHQMTSNGSHIELMRILKIKFVFNLRM